VLAILSQFECSVDENHRALASPWIARRKQLYQDAVGKGVIPDWYALSREGGTLTAGNQAELLAFSDFVFATIPFRLSGVTASGA
jgi:hypothetical protein